jgi:hypothetical protein
VINAAAHGHERALMELTEFLQLLDEARAQAARTTGRRPVSDPLPYLGQLVDSPAYPWAWRRPMSRRWRWRHCGVRLQDSNSSQPQAIKGSSPPRRTVQGSGAPRRLGPSAGTPPPSRRHIRPARGSAFGPGAWFRRTGRCAVRTR